MKKIKVMPIFGTRPDAIKMCPLIHEMRKHEEIETVVCVTGQHREMLLSVLDFCDNSFFGIFQLLGNIDAAFSKLPSTKRGAENTPSCRNAAIPIRAGKTAVERQLVYLAAKFFLVILICSLVHNITDNIIMQNHRKSNKGSTVLVKPFA